MLFILLALLTLFCSHIAWSQPEKVITFKKATQDDAPLIYSWFEHPHVKTWWPLPENETLESFTTRIRSKDTFAYVVLCDNKPIGYIQYYIVDKATDKTGAWLPEFLQPWERDSSLSWPFPVSRIPSRNSQSYTPDRSAFCARLALPI